MDAIIAAPITQSVAPLSIHAVALDVRDLDRVAAFYQDVVGLHVIGGSGSTLQLGAGGAPLLALQHRPDALPNDKTAAGLFHTAFLLPDRAALGRWLAHARSTGVMLDGAADHSVSEAVYLADPEGNGIEIYADRPPSGWTWSDTAEGGRIDMATARLDIPGLIALAADSWTGAPNKTTIGHVHLQVGEVAAAVRFITGPLGMDLTASRPSAAFLSTGGYHHHLAVNVWNSGGAPARDPRRAGLAAVTLAAADDTVLAGFIRRNRASSLRDPWGTQFHVVSSTAR